MSTLSRFGRFVPLMLAALQALALQAYSQSTASDVDALTARADIVAVGKVVSLRSEWSDDRRRIVTRATVAVDEYLKGELSLRSLVITVPGGEVDGVGELYSHSARFKNDEHVVVFVERDARGALRMTGGEQGKLSITKDELTHKQMVAHQRTLDELKTRVRLATQRQNDNK
jgi:hypothetical protein